MAGIGISVLPLIFTTPNLTMHDFDEPSEHPGVEVYTYGYGKQGNLRDLIKYSVDLDAFVVDTRFSPSSKNPTWRQANLRDSLGTIRDVSANPDDGVPRYVHLQCCGNENYKDWDAPTSIADPPQCKQMLHNYVTGEHSVILLCYCPTPSDCHRSQVCSMLRDEHGHDFIHLRPRSNPQQRSLV